MKERAPSLHRARDVLPAGSRGEPLTGFRRVASALWGAPEDSQIYGMLEVDASPLLAFMAEARARGEHVTPTHLVGRAIGYAISQTPALNVRLVGSRAVPRDGIDVFFITSIHGGADLSGTKIEHIDRKGVAEVARELEQRSQRLRRGRDPEFEASKRMFDRLPRPVLRALLRIVAWAVGDRAWNIPALKLSASPFGSAMVSSVGMFGLPMGFSPIVWMYRVPVLILVGEIQERPVAVQGRCEVRPVLSLCATLDHRYMDGSHIAQAVAALRRYLAAPADFEPAASDLGVQPGTPASAAAPPQSSQMPRTGCAG